MRLNKDQLQSQARDFALTNELAATYSHAAKFWPTFREDIKSLASFADRLGRTHVQCAQPAEGWLLDHIAFLRTQGQEVLRMLPQQTLRRLPQFKASGMPQIYGLCNDYLEHTDGRYDAESFEQYIQAYQEVFVLSTLECWTLPSAMRVAIIRRLAATMREVRHRHEVCESIDSLLEKLRHSAHTGDDVRKLLNTMAQSRTFTPVEVVHLVRHLTEYEPHVQVVRQWLSAYVAQSAASLEQMTALEHQLQADLQVIAGDLVTSLHMVERQSWQKTFAHISQVEQIFSADGPSEYQAMDLASQDLLRSRTVVIAHRLNVPDTLVANTAVTLAAEARTKNLSRSNRPQFPAYYLLDPDGLFTLSNAITNLARPRRFPKINLKRRPLATYLAPQAVIFLALTALAADLATNALPFGGWSILAVCLALAIPVSQWATVAVQDAVVRYTTPKMLLRYDLSDHVPDDAKTMVVIPVIWSSVDDVDDVMDRLLVHFLANRQANLYFAVLGDFEDQPQKDAPGDADLLAHAVNKITLLCNEYGPDRFFLFHRARRYNPADQVYMGWERKRGKLVEFVELLRGNQNTSYTTAYGATERLHEIRYILTVDHDTKLPIGAASRLVGTIHFPYNRPALNPEGTRVVDGFGIIQPRVTVSYESTQRSRFAALWAGEPGIDPYAFAISDPFQDLFGQASFSGKGIFDVDAFHSILADRIPDQMVLSHDLLEGGFLRTGLAQDIEFVEDHPRSFYSHQLRAERWTRGDWQLIGWLGPQLKNRHGVRQRVDLSRLTRLQIVENMRRSLVSPSLMVLALLGVSILPGRSDVYEGVVLLTLFLPFLESIQNPLSVNQRTRQRIGYSFFQSLLQLMTLPFTATATIMAIFRSLYRLWVSQRHLLEWTSLKKSEDGSSPHVFVSEPIGYAVIFLFTGLAWAIHPQSSWPWGTLFPILWILARPVIRQLNQPTDQPDPGPEDDEAAELIAWTKKIWSFFEDHVTADESWLPPDNVQYYPKEIRAHRTSPTNIGLYLAAIVAAHDLGLITDTIALDRLELTMTSVQSLETWHGHLFNWYDTRSLAPLPPRYVSTVDSGNFITYLILVRQALRRWVHPTAHDQERITTMLAHIQTWIAATDFRILYDSDARLFSLGANVDTGQQEVVLYDLLASEARQTSFIAIALGQIPVSHWFTLGRTMTIAGGQKTLVSWSGTMFEYLLPALLFRTYRHTVWDSSYRAVIAQQKAYAGFRKVPFGISESGYFAFDYQLNYQYHAFGVPGLGLARGLDQDLVIAPYATMLALPFAPAPARAALRQSQALGATGQYGFFEALDFTPRRMPEGSHYQIIQSFMAHHQAMSLLALTNRLLHNRLIERFHHDPEVRAAELLLQERVSERAALLAMPIDVRDQPDLEGPKDQDGRHFTAPLAVPEINVVSNGRMTSIISDKGNSRLGWKSIDVNRWQGDPLASEDGLAIYLHDATLARTWSATPFPCGLPSQVEATFRLGKSIFEGKGHDLSWTLEVTVHPELDAEVRRIRLTNTSGIERRLAITAFQDLSLAPAAADRAHPAFSKLFIQTSYDAVRHCLLAHRRPHAPDEDDIWGVYALYTDSASAEDCEFDTDRAAFVGRGRTLANPQGLDGPLAGRVGAVVNPSFTLRRTLRLRAGESACVYVVTGVAQSQDQALSLIDGLSDSSQADRAFHLAWIRTQIDLHHLHLSSQEAIDAQVLAGRLLLPCPLTEERQNALMGNSLKPKALWRFGISDLAPVAVVEIIHSADMAFLVDIARQHQYLCTTLNLDLTLVIIDDSAHDVPLDIPLRDHLAAQGLAPIQRITSLIGASLSPEERTLLKALARVWLTANGPSLLAQLGARTRKSAQILPHPTDHHPRQSSHAIALASQENIEFFNGYGGFIEQGKAYTMTVSPSLTLPRPWSNILANPEFGGLITELGTGYTWWRNSREFKLTPWSNDPVSDRISEVVYLTDMDSHEIWSATPSPASLDRTFRVTHGFGYTRFEHSHGDIRHTLEVTVPPQDPVKLMHLALKNASDRPRNIAVSAYVAWVLGVDLHDESSFVETKWDPRSEILTARNAHQDTLPDALAFLHVSRPDLSTEVRSLGLSYTGDRSEFIGVTGSEAHPHALAAPRLSNRVGVFSSACGAIQTIVEVPAHGELRLVVVLGCTRSMSEATGLIERYASPSDYPSAFDDVRDLWQRTTSQIQVKTPSRTMDILLNGWLLYQTLGCRMYARTAFYQAGGAYGFRDQLQDSLALLHTDSSYAYKQILRSAAHQYREGDVQHWWHDDIQKGIRTRISDDLLWLPYAVARYIEQTGHIDLLHQEVPYLTSPTLKTGESDRFESIIVGPERGTMFDHCLRAIDHAARFGVHGIPLIGTGDWNDGMSRIGENGQGESVWLGWFLLDIYQRFLQLDTDLISDTLRQQWQTRRDELWRQLNQYAWDGSWFRRAFTDAGRWLGSKDDGECRIDAIAQSWSVLTHGTTLTRQRLAMESFDRYLVDRDLGLARLLTPAFDRTRPSPGYIQGYPPGIRENGGQYTHGVIWSIIAWAVLKRTDKAFELFSLLNPITHTETPEAVSVYGNEPYVMSADIYTAAPFPGRAGWSWYTGSAGWMYQAGLEYILGVTLRGRDLYIDPCVPEQWDGFDLTYRYRTATYTIRVNIDHHRTDPPEWEQDDGTRAFGPCLPLMDDHREHSVVFYWGPNAKSPDGVRVADMLTQT